MRRYLLERLAWAIPIIVVIVVLNFLLTRLIPGDPITAIVGDYPVPPEYIEEARRSFGLDQPVYVQLFKYLALVFQGDLGYSYANRESVLHIVLTRASATLMLMIPALLLAIVIGLLQARWAAPRPGGTGDVLITCVTLFGYSIPVFWLGQMLIVLFAVNLHWLPAQGMFSMRGVASGWPRVWDFFVHWLMPGACVASFYAASISRVAKASLQDALNQDFVTTARAKGVSETATFWRHVFPNALIPIVTVIGYQFGHALTGAILVETVFGWPGLGTLFINSITNRDYPVLQGIFLFAATLVVVVNLLTDIAYGIVDPRVRAGYLSAR
jgi:peptide/nickel transport system permease protein